MEVLEAVQPGPLTTVQDAGRYGYQQYGVPPSGAMDNYAFRIGNLLAGNEEGAASLELTLSGGRWRALADMVIAITGADLAPVLNGRPVPLWETISICRGDVLVFSYTRSGCRAYLAVSGGINVPRVMGSAATYTRAGIGGLGGRALRAKDVLRANESKPVTAKRQVPPEYIPQYGNQVELRVILGPQDDCFTDEGVRTFLQSRYTVSTRADRMGYRLDGPRIQHRGGADIVSDGIPMGAVQVPGDGLPIVLLADRQTTGGYTKIATVISADIPALAQSRPGDGVTFRKVTEMEARQAFIQYEKKIAMVKKRVGRVRQA